MTDFPKKLPSGPFGAWLAEYAPEGITPGVALELGVSEKVLRNCLGGYQKNVLFDSADTALQNALRIVEVDDRPIYWLDDLYPQFFVDAREAA